MYYGVLNRYTSTSIDINTVFIHLVIDYDQKIFITNVNLSTMKCYFDLIYDNGKGFYKKKWRRNSLLPENWHKVKFTHCKEKDIHNILIKNILTIWFLL